MVEKLGGGEGRFFFEGGGPKETALLGVEKERAAVGSFFQSSLFSLTTLSICHSAISFCLLGLSRSETRMREYDASKRIQRSWMLVIGVLSFLQHDTSTQFYQKLAKMGSGDYYRILKVNRKATNEELKKAYKSLAMK
ncbi:hypothetical protein K1719_031258 [Acacia pycnantha]|nr:hypothetical protein K1719_031258 [Acacia pycnantha]